MPLKLPTGLKLVCALRVEFMMDNLKHLANWLLMFGSVVKVEGFDELKGEMAELAEDLLNHNNPKGLLQS